jgi:hypothetical protein
MDSRLPEDSGKFVAGIIRIDTIDRSKQPSYGSIKRYIDNLSSQGVYVENQDVGFELSNITTDKFIVGAQEVDMYYFSNNADRDLVEIEKQKAGKPSIADALIGDQWKLETSLKQQILPYYGMLGKHAVSIPKGFGAYKQILLDATDLGADGVGTYYVATEMELRCASISYERWVDFLVTYSEVYMESVEENDAAEIFALESTPSDAGAPNNPDISNQYLVTVPRSVFPSYNKNKLRDPAKEFGTDGLPISPCNPPYGYPLYYKRANKLGIPQAGLAEIQARYTAIVTNLASLQSPDKNNFKIILNSEWSRMKELEDSSIGLTTFEITYFQKIKELMKEDDPDSAKVAEIIGLIQTDVNGMGPVSQLVSKMQKRGTSNAMKVYEFLKRIADECLGKKFLVKIPKNVNLFYSNFLATEPLFNPVQQYKFGPFGFKPRPLNPSGGYEFSQPFYDQIVRDRLKIISPANEQDHHKFHTFLSSGIQPDYPKPTGYVGNLCVNYNPISENHEFNYQPTNLGGFFNFDLYQNLIPMTNMLGIGENSRPLAVNQMLVPQDLTNFMNDNSRVSAYVRFDNSEFLSFENINKDSFTQQTITASGMVPDVTNSLDNVQTEDLKGFSFDKTSENSTPLPRSVAFVKCTVDEKLYMPPKQKTYTSDVYATIVKDIGKYSRPKKLYKEGTCGEYVDSLTYYKAKYIPTTEMDFDNKVNIIDYEYSYNNILSSNLINTDLENLDTDHVYALITLPAKIIPTADSRYKDGPNQAVKAEIIKHLFTMDVVKNLEGFDKPTKCNGQVTSILNSVKKETAALAQLVAKKARETVTYAAYTVDRIAPSPVYPDLVSLPLMSKERCYGPWISSQIDVQASTYSNIGGKVEFIKEENLAPWNYNGYSLMDEAGKLQAVFSNSLLLFSERGGFVIPDIASGVSLCKNLLDNGPLVTNITMDISSAGFKTTYKFDLYTSSFGKLQKQKQDEISKISRERQKLKDEKNSLIRRGLGKAQKQFSYTDFQNSIANNPGQTSLPPPLSPTHITASVTPLTEQRWNPNGTPASIFGSASDSPPAGGPVKNDYYDSTVNMQTRQNLIDAGENFYDMEQAASSFYLSAATSFNEQYVAASKDPYHPHMAHMPDPQIKAKYSLYPTTASGITIYGVNGVT